MSNTDNITKGMGVGPTEPFTTGNGTVVASGQFGSLTKSNGMTDGTSIATASKNMAEIYNRILLDMAQCLDLACIVADPANAPYSISDLLPPAQVEARDIEQNWTPISTLAQAIIQGIYTVRTTANQALETANQAVTDGGKFSFTGSIQYEKLTNTITATGLGDNTEVGDVIRVTGTVQNNKLFTVESKINADKVVVNEAHKNGAGPLSLNDETLTSKVELLTKWYNAPLGLGQAWVNVTAVRPGSDPYTGSHANSYTDATWGQPGNKYVANNTNRAIKVKAEGAWANGTTLYINGVLHTEVHYWASNERIGGCVSEVIPPGDWYRFTNLKAGGTPAWWELR